MNAFQIALTFYAVDRVSRFMDDLQQRVGRLGSTYQQAGRQAVASGALMGAGLEKTIGAYGDLEEAMTRAQVAYLSKKGTDTLFDKISHQAERLGVLLPGTNSDFYEMATRMKELGLSSDVIQQGGLSAVAYLKTLLRDLNPRQAAELGVTFAQSLGIAKKEFVPFIDLVQRAKFGFGLDPEMFAYTLKYVGPIGKQLGIVGLEGAKSLIPITGMLKQAGLAGEQMGTSLRAIFEDLASLDDRMTKFKMGHGKFAKEILDTHGINLEFFRNGQFLGIENLIRQLEKLKALNMQDRLKVIEYLFGKESSSAIAELVSQGMEGYQRAQATLERQAGIQARLNLVMGTFKNLWEAFTGTFENLMARAGSMLGPDLKRLASGLNEISDWIDHFIQAHPDLARLFMRSAVALSGFLVVGGGSAIVFGKILNGISTTATAMGNFTGMLRRGPEAWGAITRGASTFGGWMKSGAELVRSKDRELRSLISRMKIFETIQYRGGFWNALQQGLLTTKYRFLDTVTSARSFVTAQGGILPMLRNGASGTLSFARSLGGNLLGGLRAAGSGVLSFGSTLLASPIFWIVLGIVAAAILIHKYWEPIKAFFVGLWEGITDAFKPFIDEVRPGFEFIGRLLSPIWKGLQMAWQWLSNLITPAKYTKGELAGVANVGRVVGRILGTAFMIVLWPLRMIIKLIGWVVDAFRFLFNLTVKIVGAWIEKFKNNPFAALFDLTPLGMFWDMISGLFKWLFSIDLAAAGKKILSTLVDGIKSMASKPIEAFKGVVQGIRDMLPFSPAKRGPLSTLHRVRLVETVADGMKPAPMVSAMSKTVMAVRRMLSVSSVTVQPQLAPVTGPQSIVQSLRFRIGTAPIMAAATMAMAAPQPLPPVPIDAGRHAQVLLARSQSSPVTLNYSPTIHLAGGAGPHEKEEFIKWLREHIEELRRMLEQAEARTRRTEY